MTTNLVNLACSGETTATMLAGGICTYPGSGSQLGAALAYLTAHRNRTTLITIDIGANDVDRCVSTSGISTACVAAGMAQTRTNLSVIFRELRQADPRARIIALNYYDPFLAAWLLGPTGRELAQVSLGLADQLNGLIERAAEQNRIRVAEVAEAFRSHTWRLVTDPTFGSIPTNVALVCSWTWMCTQSNIHANDAGYAVLAHAVIARLAPGDRRD